MPDRFLAVQNAAVTYGSVAKTLALRNVSVSFRRGELTLVMGPSGSGKTTLLSLLGCLLKPDSGNVYLDGTETATLSESQRTDLRRRRIGFVFQAFRLFRSLSALENVRLGGELAERVPPSGAARDLLARFGLENRAELKPDALSGGEKQRVAIARALIKNPPIVLADEPTASLDSEAGAGICGILRSLTENQQRAVVVVSHDTRWMNFAHRVVTLRDGTVVQDRSTAA